MLLAGVASQCSRLQEIQPSPAAAGACAHCADGSRHCQDRGSGSGRGPHFDRCNLQGCRRSPLSCCGCNLKRSCNVFMALTSSFKLLTRSTSRMCSLLTHWGNLNRNPESKSKSDVPGDGAEVDEEGPTSEQLSDIVAAASSVLAARGGKVSQGHESGNRESKGKNGNTRVSLVAGCHPGTSTA
jgi:hypothetical protein